VAVTGAGKRITAPGCKPSAIRSGSIRRGPNQGGCRSPKESVRKRSPRTPRFFVCFASLRIALLRIPSDPFPLGLETCGFARATERRPSARARCHPSGRATATQARPASRLDEADLRHDAVCHVQSEPHRSPQLAQGDVPLGTQKVIPTPDFRISPAGRKYRKTQENCT
jgi:hypothetical protein